MKSLALAVPIMGHPIGCNFSHLHFPGYHPKRTKRLASGKFLPEKQVNG
jgi:hypothetical protein